MAMHRNPKFIEMLCLTILLYLAQSQLHDHLVQISSWHHGLYMDGTGPSANIIILTKHGTGAYDFGIRDHILNFFYDFPLFKICFHYKIDYLFNILPNNNNSSQVIHNVHKIISYL